MKNKLNTTTMIVRNILEAEPSTRNSDNLLFIEVVKKINVDLIHRPLAEVMQNISAFNIPSIETVGRCRRKIQSEHPELRAKKSVQDCRAEREEEFREWSKAGD